MEHCRGFWCTALKGRHKKHEPRMVTRRGYGIVWQPFSSREPSWSALGFCFSPGFRWWLTVPFCRHKDVVALLQGESSPGSPPSPSCSKVWSCSSPSHQREGAVRQEKPHGATCPRVVPLWAGLVSRAARRVTGTSGWTLSDPPNALEAAKPSATEFRPLKPEQSLEKKNNTGISGRWQGKIGFWPPHQHQPSPQHQKKPRSVDKSRKAGVQRGQTITLLFLIQLTLWAEKMAEGIPLNMLAIVLWASELEKMWFH